MALLAYNCCTSIRVSPLLMHIPKLALMLIFDTVLCTRQGNICHAKGMYTLSMLHLIGGYNNNSIWARLEHFTNTQSNALRTIKLNTMHNMSIGVGIAQALDSDTGCTHYIRHRNMLHTRYYTRAPTGCQSNSHCMCQLSPS